MPISAMPEHLNSKEEIENAFPDDEQFGTTSWWGRLYRWYQKETKTWFAFSFRCTEWWARWRKYPKVLFAIKGKGYWRAELEGGDNVVGKPEIIFNRSLPAGQYLSRIQYYTRWHVALQWPLMLSWHFYPKAEDVPVPNQPRPELDGKLWFFYWNHFDADLIYWMVTSAYLGRNWK